MKKFKQFLYEMMKHNHEFELIKKAVERTTDSKDLVDLIDETKLFEDVAKNDVQNNENFPFDVEDQEVFVGGEDENGEKVDDSEYMVQGGTNETLEEFQLNESVSKEQKLLDESMTSDALEYRRSHPLTPEEVKDMACQYKMVEDKSSETGYVLMRRNEKYKPERHELTIEEINGETGILAQLNRPPSKKTFEFDEDGNLIVNGRKPNIKSKTKWIDVLNNVNRKIDPDTIFKFEVIGQKEDGKEIFSGKLQKNKDKLKQDKDNPELLDTTSSEFIDLDDDDKEKIINILTIAGTKNKKSDDVYGYDENAKCFTINGNKLTDKTEFTKLVTRLNGGVKQPDDDRWNHFMFAKEGSKIGAHVGSFSLPPIETCMGGVPCAKEGCYALKSYALRPMVASSWENNWALLNKGKKYDQFVEEALNFIKDKKLTHFRFSVSGDVLTPEYRDAIYKIASESSDVVFWLYTKNYEIFKDVSKKPSNLVVILSAWGEFKPDDSMVNNFPVAFLYDEKNPDINRYIGKDLEKKEGDGGLQVCPCTKKNKIVNVGDGKNKGSVLTCETCGICFTRKAYNNLAFLKH